MSFFWQKAPGWDKAELEKRADGYGEDLMAAAPAQAVRAIADIPIRVMEAKIRDKILNKRTPNVAREAIMGGAGGHVAGALTAPLFFGGLHQVRSDDKNEIAKGLAKVTTAGGIASFAKGMIDAKSEGHALPRMLANGRTKVLTGVPGALLAAHLSRQTSDKSQSPTHRYLKGGLIGGVGGALKGLVEHGILERKLLQGGYKRSYGRILASRAASWGAGGLVGGTVLSAILDKFGPKAKKTGGVGMAKEAAAEEPPTEAAGPLPEGLKPELRLKPHQERFVQRVLTNGGRAAGAHAVGSGKCLRGDTVIWTSRGIVKIESLFPKDWDGSELWLDADDDLFVSSLTESGEVVTSKPDKLFAQRLPDNETTIRFKTARGLVFEVTRQHPLPTLRNGEVTWVPAHQWESGDCLVTPVLVKPIAPVRVDQRLLEMLAWQITEGYDGPKGAISVTQDDTGVLHRLKSLYEDLSGRSATVTKYKNKSPIVRYNYVGIKNACEAIGYEYGNKSAFKKLPSAFLNLPEDQAVFLLRILFEAEGSVSTNPHSVEYPSASELLCRQVQTLLAQVGVRSTIKSKMGQATNGKRIMRQYWRVSIYGSDARTFSERVGFLGAAKSALLLSVTPPPHAWSKYGADISDVVADLKAIGLMFAVRGINNTANAVGPATLKAISKKLRDGPSLKDDYRRGIAGAWRKRTEEAWAEGHQLAGEIASRLDVLSSGELTFDMVAEVAEGAAGGVVYDLSVPTHHNFVATYGGLFLHNTISSIAAVDRMRRSGMAKKVVVVVPAGLKKNYVDAVNKVSTFSSQILGPKGESGGVYLDQIDPNKTFTVVSYDMFRRDPDRVMQATGADTLIFDEFHKARSTSSSNYKAGVIARKYAPNFIGLTGSLTNNNPAEVVPLANLVAGRVVMTPAEFNARYKVRVGTQRGFMGGRQSVSGLRNVEDLKRRLGSFVDYVSIDDVGAEMPRRRLEEKRIAMSNEQRAYYEFAMRRVDPATAYKIRNNLPVDHKEAAHAFQMIQQARQAANSIAPFNSKVTLEDAAERTPKIKSVLDDAQEHLRVTPDGQIVMYSNLIKGGVDVLTAGLRKRGVDHAVFVGKDREINGEKITSDVRNQGVEDYLAGKKKVIVVSPAGAEGLDLRNSTFFQGVDGHFNPERTRQAEARARRMGGLAHRPIEKREVLVRRYFTTYPEQGGFKSFLGFKKPTTTDEWIHSVANQKHQLNQKLLGAFKQPAATGQQVDPLQAPTKPPTYVRRWKDVRGEWRYEYAQ